MENKKTAELERSASEYVGKNGIVKIDKYFDVRVNIQDVRRDFGHTRLLIKPLEGEGQKWVNAERVTLELKNKASSRNK